MSALHPKATITRLANSAKGEPYKIETITGLAPTAANEQASQWWQSGGTLAMTITIEGAEDSRYEREYLDAARLPKGWAARVQPITKRSADEILKQPDEAVKKKPVQETPAPERKAPAIGPTLFNPPERPAKGTAQPGATSGLCWTCFGPVGSQDPESKQIDRTPAGRLDQLRCPECGRPMPGVRRSAIERRYLHAQHSKGSAEQSAHVGPQRRKKGQ